MTEKPKEVETITLTFVEEDGTENELELTTEQASDFGVYDAAVIVRKGRHYTYQKAHTFQYGILISLDRSDLKEISE